MVSYPIIWMNGNVITIGNHNKRCNAQPAVRCGLPVMLICALSLFFLTGFIRFIPDNAIREHALILVNKDVHLPRDYVPTDLVTVNIAFTGSELYA